MATEAKTTWERVMDALAIERPGVSIPEEPDRQFWPVTTLAIRRVCDELDAANLRIADLERQVREMATGGRR